MFNKDDLFLICDDGFDFSYKERTSSFTSVVHKTNFLPDNYLKYMEITDVIKYKTKRTYKCHFFMENKSVTNGLWGINSEDDYPDYNKGLYKTLSDKIIKSKIENKIITPCKWSDLAKEELVKENDT